MQFREIRHSLKRSLLKIGFHKYPDFLIIGAQKAGTTFLYSVLRQHPQIIEPVHKEAHFFDYDWNFDKGLFHYKLNFDLSFRFKKSQKTFEATPDYLAHKEVPKRLSNYFPHIKMIMILREPVSRAYSAWKMHHFLFQNHRKNSWLYDPRTFQNVVEDGLNEKSNGWDLLNHVGRSLYGMQIENYMNYFEKDQFLILFQKDLEEAPQKVIYEICRFVNIEEFDLLSLNKNDPRFWENKSVVSNESVEQLPFQDELHEFYAEDKIRLEKIIDKRVPW
jgi:hypothetical protein